MKVLKNASFSHADALVRMNFRCSKGRPCETEANALVLPPTGFPSWLCRTPPTWVKALYLSEPRFPQLQNDDCKPQKQRSIPGHWYHESIHAKGF